MRANKVVVTLSFPVEIKWAAQSDVASLVERHLYKWFKDLNENLTGSIVFGEPTVEKIELEGVENVRQHKLDFEN